MPRRLVLLAVVAAALVLTVGAAAHHNPGHCRPNHPQDCPPPPPPPAPPPAWVIDPPAGPFVVYDGGGTVARGPYFDAYALERGPRTVAKIDARNHTRVNTGAMFWRDGQAHPVSPGVLFEDMLLSNACAVPPGSTNGTAEANLWAGATGTYRRFEARNGCIMGVWVGGSTYLARGGCWGCVLQDFRVLDQTNVGVYLEHTTTFTVLREFSVVAARPINVEWWYGTKIGEHDILIENFELRCVPAGGTPVFVDAGNYGFTIRNGTIRDCGPIRLPLNRVMDRPNVVQNVVDGNGNPVQVTYHANAHNYTGPLPVPEEIPPWWPGGSPPP